MTETEYQRRLSNRIREILPGAFVMKNNPKEIQGIPDLLVLWGPYWAMLEVKLSADADHQPNQDHYIEAFANMSFAAFVYPENEEAVLSELQQAFGVTG